MDFAGAVPEGIGNKMLILDETGKQADGQTGKEAKRQTSVYTCTMSAYRNYNQCAAETHIDRDLIVSAYIA